MKPQEPVVIEAPWSALTRFTDARIALGRAGHSLPTAAHLDFQLAHAQARDAVQLPLDALGLAQSIEATGLSALGLHSAAIDRTTYLQRPDLGRRLDAHSRNLLQAWQAANAGATRFDLAFVVADGLSALAIHNNATPLLEALVLRLRADSQFPWSIGPVAVVEQGRVAIGDEVCELLQADAVAVLIGERPGLSSPDSMGIYLTWGARLGCHDAQRNCISNVRKSGLSPELAARKLHHLLQRARTLRLTGIGLKDESDEVGSGRLPRPAKVPT